MDKEFKKFIERLDKGAQNTYFRDVVEATSNKKVLPVKGRYLQKSKALKKFIKFNIKKINHEVVKKGGRPNEMSNLIEKILRNIIKTKDMAAEVPRDKKGKKRSAGYPDIWVKFKDGKIIYLEIKVFQKKTLRSGLRTFYFKASKKSKISTNAPHLLASFEIESKEGNNRSPFVIKSFKLLDLYDLKVNLKPEFNANNPQLFACNEI